MRKILILFAAVLIYSCQNPGGDAAPETVKEFNPVLINQEAEYDDHSLFNSSDSKDGQAVKDPCDASQGQPISRVSDQCKISKHETIEFTFEDEIPYFGGRTFRLIQQDWHCCPTTEESPYIRYKFQILFTNGLWGELEPISDVRFANPSAESFYVALITQHREKYERMPYIKYIEGRHNQYTYAFDTANYKIVLHDLLEAFYYPNKFDHGNLVPPYNP